MDLISKYNQFYEDAVSGLRKNDYQIDSFLKEKNDNRFGLTLLLRFPETIRNQIQLFITELQRDNYEQYFYPDSDLHITVLSIISCEENFKLNSIDLENYINIITETLARFSPFEIHLKGITASSSAIMIQGFPTSDVLQQIRASLQLAFQQTKLKQSINKRYTLETAHSTVCRYQEPLSNIEKLELTMAKFRDFEFGKFSVVELELVYNDWYQKSEKTVLLKRFNFQ
ncbi:2'-5' RNA ligase family protein [Flavobacterium agrisoli]|uniref:2'-5' RNA ligase family protein n=1 Tax=Flavobacterium agrisoli TaxID=2793066 RepID=A0A934PLN2_9FLAO|nr:2'-5' RNA ligase family protein [Flavobacterium agrisoli]MBK0369862.1 2'-5' RNA ligase family protein [Flavobacterium agrisoli]